MTEDKHREKIEHDLCADWVPDETRAAIWRKAWDDGRPYGVGEVRLQYDDIMDIIRTLEPKAESLT